MDITAALPIFVITLREGVEASLVVGIVLACLQKAGQTQLNRWVYQGIGGGVVASVLVGFLLGGLFQEVENYDSPYTPFLKAVLAALFGLMALVMLSWMLIWMTKQAKSLKAEVESEIRQALSSSADAGRVIFLVVFIAVLREGFETVLFVLTKFQSGWQSPTLGAIAGLGLAVLFGYLLFKVGVKVNLKLFFQVMGSLLLLIVGGLAIGILKEVELAAQLLIQLQPSYEFLCVVPGQSCLLGNLVWDGSEILPDRQFPGILLKALLGYRQLLYSVQLIAYGLFMGVMGFFYFGALGGTNGGKISTQVDLKSYNQK
ncbi:MAG: FTR1 family iron permease [Microcystaceae cyanobacterium]